MNKVFTVTAADCRRDTYRGSGAGGQNRNKRDTGVRFVHEPSGAVGECEEQRSQPQNASVAFQRMAKSKKFQAWAKMQAAAIIEGHRSIDAKVDKMLADDNLRVEVGVDCGPREAFCDKDGRRP